MMSGRAFEVLKGKESKDTCKKLLRRGLHMKPRRLRCLLPSNNTKKLAEELQQLGSACINITNLNMLSIMYKHHSTSWEEYNARKQD